jgi:hypothetical protein
MTRKKKRSHKKMSRILNTLTALLIVLGCSQAAVHAQSIIAEQQQLQQQVDELRRDVNDLQSTVGGLRRAILRQGTAAQQPADTKPASQTRPGRSNASPVEDGKIKAQVCQAVGHFFGQIDRALKMSDGDAAEEFMRKAVAQLNSELDRYSTYGQVRHILTLAEGLAWDTYTAVEARYITVGNTDFIQAIEDYRKRYKTVCPSD